MYKTQTEHPVLVHALGTIATKFWLLTVPCFNIEVSAGHPISQNHLLTMKSGPAVVLLVFAQLQISLGLRNGVGLKPHMGWSSWVGQLAPEFMGKSLGD